MLAKITQLTQIGPLLAPTAPFIMNLEKFATIPHLHIRHPSLQHLPYDKKYSTLGVYKTKAGLQSQVDS